MQDAASEAQDKMQNTRLKAQGEMTNENKVIFRKDVGEWPDEETEGKTEARSTDQSEETTESSAPPALKETAQVTTGQSNALRSAKSYLDYTAFSYQGLIEQLEYKEYSHEDAVYAADHCGADWNEQAAKKAKHYLDYTSFSRNGLISQLEYEGFTHEQAVYGVEANGY